MYENAPIHYYSTFPLQIAFECRILWGFFSLTLVTTSLKMNDCLISEL